MSALGDFQERFAAALFDPALNLGAGPELGFSVYRNTVLKGLIDVLSANYPTVERLVGTEWFAAAANIYVRRHRPREASMALYGAAFAEFLRDFPPANALPYLPEIAHLDRCWTEAHFAADAAVLPAEWLAMYAPQQLQNLQLRLHPSVRIVWCAHSAFTLWRINRPPADVPTEIQIEDAEEGALFIRPTGSVQAMELTRAEHSFLSLLHARRALGPAAIQVLHRQPDADIGAMLARCIRAGVFTDIEENNND